jgi:hypothetical protein
MELISNSIVCSIAVLLGFYCIQLKAANLALLKENTDLKSTVVENDKVIADYERKDTKKINPGFFAGNGSSPYQMPQV